MASNANLIVNIGANTTGFTGGINQVTQQTQQLSHSLSKIGAVIGAAFAADKIISFAKEASQLAQVAEGVEIAFKRIGGDQIMGQLQKATKGTVSDLELMKAAVQASNFKIPLEQLGSLLAFAHQRAKDTGQSVDYLVQSIVLGIGRKSPLILDNLGISAVALREKFHGLNAEQKTVADVAKAVGEIASEEMAKVGESVETTGEKTARVASSFANMKVGIGEFVNIIVAKLSPALTTFFNAMANGLKSVQDIIKEVKTQTASAAVTNAMTYIDDIAKGYKSRGINKGSEREKAFEAYKANIEAAINSYEEKAFWSSGEKANSEKQIKLLQEELKAVTDIFNQKKEALKVDGDSLKILDEKIDKTSWLSEWGKGGQTGSKPVYSTDEDRMMSGLFGDQMQTIGGLGLTGDTKSGLQMLDEYAEAYKGTATAISEASLEMSSAMSQFAEEFAAGIGDLMAGASSFSDFGNVIIKAVASFMRSLGSQLIALGMAGIAAKMLAKNPYAALAAGIALVALSSAATAAMSGNPMSGSGGGYSVSSGSYSGMQSNKDMKLEIVGMVKGTDIYWSQKRLEQQLNNTTVRSGR